MCVHSPEMMRCTLKLERFAMLVCGSSKLNALQSKVKLYTEETLKEQHNTKEWDEPMCHGRVDWLSSTRVKGSLEG